MKCHFNYNFNNYTLYKKKSNFLACDNNLMSIKMFF